MARVTVLEFERVVKLVDGRVSGVLGPGRHRYRRRRTRLHRFDIRPRLLTVPGQEVLTSDGIAVRLTAVMRVSIVDPVAQLTAAQDPQAEVYTAVQQALRIAVAQLGLDALVESRMELAPEIAEPVHGAAARVGLRVEDLTVRDLMLPGDLRRAYAEVLLAKQRGRAELERARSEAAALRSLANTADLLDKHPALLRLRTLQAAESGTTKLVVKNG